MAIITKKATKKDNGVKFCHHCGGKNDRCKVCEGTGVMLYDENFKNNLNQGFSDDDWVDEDED